MKLGNAAAILDFTHNTPRASDTTMMSKSKLKAELKHTFDKQRYPATYYKCSLISIFVLIYLEVVLPIA